MPRQNSSTTKAKYWILTIPLNEFTPIYLPGIFVFMQGQMEEGTNTGYRHYQCFGITGSQCRISAIKKFLPTAHIEATRSKAAETYCIKDDTAIEGTRFSLGTRPFKRNDLDDWDRILASAKKGEFDDIPANVLIGHYRNLKNIAAENSSAPAIEKTCTVYWGPTGTGKSRRAWGEASLEAYPKDPCTKFWDGYRGQTNVVIDEFRGSISISHMLRWLDRYPVLVEVKGSSTVFKATHIWITSNLHPKDWYKDLDEITIDALLRRLEIIEMN